MKRIVCALFLIVFLPYNTKGQSAQSGSPIPFVEARADFPREEKKLRKWDAPVIADLDQDGYLDLLLNDHGFSVRVCWNNKGRFALPYDLIMGDMHGVSVGDLDRDGTLEIVISRGGGSGSNARNSKIFRVDKHRNFTEVPDFNPPLELMRGRTVKFVDLDNDGDLDLLNFAFPDREKNGKSENYIYENDGKGRLALSSTLPPVRSDGQKTTLTDFNSDAIVDILLYGHGKVKAYQGRGDLTFEDVTDAVLPVGLTQVTGIVEFDYDNDGDFDLFLTRGKEFEIGETFYDPETQTWGFFTKRGKFRFDDLVVGDVLHIENYQTQWPHNDAFYIGESAYDYAFPGETHSGKNFRLVNSDALGFPDKLIKKGTYIGYVGNRTWRLAGDIWSPATGVVHGVSSYPAYEHPEGPSDILLENRNGKFKDVTKQANLYLKEHTTGVAAADFDNNGWQDLLIMRRGDLIHQNEALVHLNRGKAGFTLLNRHNIVSQELGAIGAGVETLDYNQDGWVDVVFGSERGKWHLFKNTMQQGADSAKYIVVDVGNSESGKATGHGALVSVKACRTEQVKRVGSTGAAYSRGFNNFVHFGLGVCDGPVRVKVAWTNGETAERTITSLGGTVVFGQKM